MFLKQEKPEMDDFERKTKFGSEGKVLSKIQYFKKILKKKCPGFNWYPCKNFTIFLHIFLFQNILSAFFLF